MSVAATCNSYNVSRITGGPCGRGRVGQHARRVCGDAGARDPAESKEGRGGWWNGVVLVGERTGAGGVFVVRGTTGRGTGWGRFLLSDRGGSGAGRWQRRLGPRGTGRRRGGLAEARHAQAGPVAYVKRQHDRSVTTRVAVSAPRASRRSVGTVAVAGDALARHVLQVLLGEPVVATALTRFHFGNVEKAERPVRTTRLHHVVRRGKETEAASSSGTRHHGRHDRRREGDRVGAWRHRREIKRIGEGGPVHAFSYISRSRGQTDARCHLAARPGRGATGLGPRVRRKSISTLYMTESPLHGFPLPATLPGECAARRCRSEPCAPHPSGHD
jgi:hypothetical protein